MKKITRKGDIDEAVQQALAVFRTNDFKPFVKSLHGTLLQNRVRFPLLEYAAKQLYDALPAAVHPKLIDAIAATQEIGAFPLAGKWLQLLLPASRKKQFRQAETIIIAGDEWYVCDILGERVFGHALLLYPEETLPALQELNKHENEWMRRVVGVAGHYAVKKGLPAVHVEQLFRILLEQADADGYQMKRGIGWAAKTTAKFHPAIIRKFGKEIEAAGQWFRTKVKIGSERASHAGRY